ncbi:type IX secretion system protein PorD [Myroides guanonis]|uniref:DUF4835 domain-containing protein n=1 Tax=Myroides guanonis TaxID=1150112 RepID=A0A1I3NEP9_9FLAO|nr:DUF4835 family protein [Myroides guanonis]SFJ07662.1 protein of unknown function [Myroides guanonis]
MRKIFFLICFIFSSATSISQELNAVVSINHSQIGNSNQAYFKTLQTALTEFINNTRWTTKNVSSLEKIDCVFYLNVNSYESNAVSGSLQVQSSRVVYNSTYNAPIFNFNDRDVSFSYTEFENLYYNPNSFDSNLTSLIAFYVNIILGLDADSFAKNGGTEFFQNASNITSLAQQSGYKGWKQGDGNNNRYFLVNDILSSANKSFRDAIYEYHRLGLDEMADNLQKGKDGVYSSLNTLSELHKNRPNAFLTRVFFDAKTDELVSMYGGVMDSNKKKVVEILNKISPLNASKWNNL